jgi:anaerobic ribonucleoside-triphosphate reductase activating protein
MYWQLNRLQFPVYNLGFGKRLAIWVQGCNLGCEGCINPELWTASGGRSLDLEQFVISILPAINLFDGITITGGEPFQQYGQLIAFCTFLKQKTNINILVFSGYTLEELVEKYPDKLFLSCINQLVDGRYIHGHGEKNTIRGSSNQKIYTFESGKIQRSEKIMNNSKWSFVMDQEKKVFMAGIPGKGQIQRIKERLSKTGIKIEF